jgi:hypothetical protein
MRTVEAPSICKYIFNPLMVSEFTLSLPKGTMSVLLFSPFN